MLCKCSKNTLKVSISYCPGGNMASSFACLKGAPTVRISTYLGVFLSEAPEKSEAEATSSLDLNNVSSIPRQNVIE